MTRNNKEDFSNLRAAPPDLSFANRLFSFWSKVVTMCFEFLSCLLSSVRPKPIFWFWSDTETQIGLIVSADTVTNTETTFQRENLVTNSMGYFFNHKRAP